MIVDEHVRTGIVAEAEDAIGHLYGLARFEQTGRAFGFEQRVTGDSDATIARIRVRSRAEMVVEIDRTLGIGDVQAGDCRATSNGVSVDSTRPFLLRPGHARSWSNDVDLMMVNLDLAALSRHAGAPLSQERLRVTATGPKSADHTIHWRRTVAYVGQVFDDVELLRSDLIRRSAVDALIVAALLTFPIDDRAEVPASRTLVSHAVRRATQFIDDNAALPIDTADVATAARLSARGLQLAFQRELGTTPMRYLRSVRLDAARADLHAASAGDSAVADIAHRWGFVHLGRFAQAYREQFGELPRKTLER